jgi:hypothetical protein
VSDERRQHPRFTIEIDVSYVNRDRDLRVSAKDVSLGGLFLYDHDPPPCETILDLTLHLPGEPGDLGIKGEVMHSLPGRGMGVRFVFDEGEALDRLRDFIAELTVPA